MGQLLTETRNGTVINTMTYDKYGNIKSKNGVVYEYDGEWKDKLVKIGDKTLSYDAQGNPTTYGEKTFTWEKGRQLKEIVISLAGGNFVNEMQCTYNANGIRTSKTYNGVKHTYTLEGRKIIKETGDWGTIVPMYDNEDSVCGIIYNDTPYYFLKNLQGDVIAITDSDGEEVVKYTYDAWGKTIDFDYDPQYHSLFIANPYRYRGYYFDAETGLYYLQSRYYDPETGRFLNADEPNLVATTGGNLFTYCKNCPVKNADYTGFASESVCPEEQYYPSGYDFIYGQGNQSVANIPVGFSNTAESGCGWVATYNALILLGKRPNIETILLEYTISGIVLFGFLGIEPGAIVRFFFFRGYTVKCTYRISDMDAVAKRHTVNILLFFYWLGGHYVAFYWDGKQFIGYNTYNDDTSPRKLGTSISKKFNSNGNRIGMLISISN